MENELDNCKFVPNQAGEDGQPDLDNDGIGDACDDDIDGDLKTNIEDPCPYNATLDAPSEEERAVCFQTLMAIASVRSIHSAKTTAQQSPTNQLDTDEDGIGDKCDGDQDGDGIPNKYDNCKLMANVDQIDIDRDGKGDDCDDRFCFAVYGDTENCLDPEATLAVYSQSLLANTGDEVPLRLFINRTNREFRYRWSVSASPEGSKLRRLKVLLSSRLHSNIDI